MCQKMGKKKWNQSSLNNAFHIHSLQISIHFNICSSGIFANSPNFFISGFGTNVQRYILENI